MLQRLMNKKWIFGLLGILILAAAFGRIMITPAEEYRFVTWGKGEKDNEVKIEIMLSARDNVQKTGTFQVQFGVASDGREEIEEDDISFKFDNAIKDNSKITVKTYRYNQDQGTLTIYVSGTEDDTLKKGSVLSLGTITVEAGSDVTFSVAENGCKVADENFEEQNISVFGSQDKYTVKNQSGSETPGEETPDDNPGGNTPGEETPGGNSPDDNPGGDTPGEDTPGDMPDDSPGGNEPEEKPERTEHSDSQNSTWEDPAETKGTWQVKDGNWNFEKEDGTSAQNEWIKVDGQWYWIGADGKMITGWINLNNVWYFCSPSGAMKTGWVNTGDRWFYFNPSGAMKTGWVQEKGYWYYMGESGAMKTGWAEAGGKWYYLDESGRMLADTVTPDGVRVDKNGVRTE